MASARSEEPRPRFTDFVFSVTATSSTPRWWWLLLLSAVGVGLGIAIAVPLKPWLAVGLGVLVFLGVIAFGTFTLTYIDHRLHVRRARRRVIERRNGRDA